MMFKKLFSTVILGLALVVIFSAPALSATDEAYRAAAHLYDLNLLKGVSENADGTPDFALDRTLTRQEGIILFVRLLGKEQEALAGDWRSPFTDVSGWAQPYVDYAYERHLTQGVGQNSFGGGNSLLPAQYLTFVLRALGYSSDSDFSWDQPWQLADWLGLPASRFSGKSSFTRGDAVIISDLALGVKIKNTDQTLSDTLPAAADDDQPVVALTFDDGPNGTVTPLLLEALAERGIKATFFVVGERVTENPDLVKAAYEAGNQICNHTYSHLDLTSLSDGQLAYQIDTTSDLIESITGEAPRYVRPPYGYIDRETESHIGLPLMLWTVDPRDWESKDADAVYDQVMSHIYDGAVILMHDQYPSTYEAAVRIMDTLIMQNWRFLTLEQYFDYYGITPEPGHTYRGTAQFL